MDDASLDDFLGGDDSDDEAGPTTDEADREGTTMADEAGGETSEAGTESGADDEESGDEPSPGGAGDETVTAGGDEADDDEEGRVDPTGVDPATTTYAWSSSGATCADCGETTERRWQQDGELVCPACKDW